MYSLHSKILEDREKMSRRICLAVFGIKETLDYARLNKGGSHSLDT